eukprot:2015398-Pyramimonas_sp.AAC.1
MYKVYDLEYTFCITFVYLTGTRLPAVHAAVVLCRHKDPLNKVILVCRPPCTAWNEAIAAVEQQQYERAALLYECAAKVYKALHASQDAQYAENKQQRLALLLAASAHLESICNRSPPPKVCPPVTPVSLPS